MSITNNTNRTFTQEDLPKHLRSCPDPLSEQEIDQAYEVWMRTYENTTGDELIKPFIGINPLSIKRYSLAEDEPDCTLSMLREARLALIYSLRSAARKLGCSDTNWRQLETAEIDGSITLASLRKAAAAIDCELVYAIKPVGGVTFSRAVFNILLEPNRYRRNFNNCVPLMRPNLLASFIRDQLRNAKFRRAKGMTRKLR